MIENGAQISLDMEIEISVRYLLRIISNDCKIIGFCTSNLEILVYIYQMFWKIQLCK